MRVLFVCSGNICRSPMAEGYFRDRIAGAGLSHVVADSAGTLGIEGRPASPEAVQAMAEIGVDISSHLSRGVTASDMTTADLVVAMAHDHLVWLAERHPGGRGERVLLRAFDDGPEPGDVADDLPDPIGAPLRVYLATRERIVTAVDHLVLHLKHRA